jgi:hypothetical protein
MMVTKPLVGLALAAVLAGCQDDSQKCLAVPSEVLACQRACAAGNVGYGGCLTAAERQTEPKQALQYFERACDGGEPVGCTRALRVRIDQLYPSRAELGAADAGTVLASVPTPDELAALRQAAKRECEGGGECWPMFVVSIGDGTETALEEVWPTMCNNDEHSRLPRERHPDAPEPALVWDDCGFLRALGTEVGNVRRSCDTGDLSGCKRWTEFLLCIDPPRAGGAIAVEHKMRKLGSAVTVEQLARARTRGNCRRLNASVRRWSNQLMGLPAKGGGPDNPHSRQASPEELAKLRATAAVRMTLIEPVSAVDPAVASALFVRQTPGVRECYLQALELNPSLRGELLIDAAVDGTGHFWDLHLGGDLPDGGVVHCVRDAFRSPGLPPEALGSTLRIRCELAPSAGELAPALGTNPTQPQGATASARPR